MSLLRAPHFVAGQPLSPCGDGDQVMSELSVVLATGGTAGHIEPALNLADALRRIDPTVRITVIGSNRGLETSLVPARGYELRTVAAVPLPRKPSIDLLLVTPRVSGAVSDAAAILREVGADVAVGFGGYASLPTYLAARRTKTPLVIHEANARAGVANKLGARLTKNVITTVPGSLPHATVMGLPLRTAIASLDRQATRHGARDHFDIPADAKVLLVFGGSQGAAHFNAVIAESLKQLTKSGIWILHAFGSKNETPNAQPGYIPVPYIDRMDLAYAAADLAITRAGAMTCAELSAVGLPAIYVPLPIGNGEQRLNALPIVEAGGGLIVDDADFDTDWLINATAHLLNDEEELEAMAEAAASLGIRDADAQLARLVLDIAAKHGATA
jgi:UDP-N-acetylglucosamine--N-acetylmuramyl-(pentapeptide) pyrophosphoryl-undecaprenol N-acetylglucosamine transferase